MIMHAYHFKNELTKRDSIIAAKKGKKDLNFNEQIFDHIQSALSISLKTEEVLVRGKDEPAIQEIIMILNKLLGEAMDVSYLLLERKYQEQGLAIHGLLGHIPENKGETHNDYKEKLSFLNGEPRKKTRYL